MHCIVRWGVVKYYMTVMLISLLRLPDVLKLLYPQLSL